MNKKISEKISSRLDDLIEEITELIPTGNRLENAAYFEGHYDDYTTGFYKIKTSAINLFNLLGKNELSIKSESLVATGSHLLQLKGMLLAIREDLNFGLIESINSTIEANIFADYLMQAEDLLLEGKEGNFDHVPAAVLTGAILEDALRRICSKQEPIIVVNKGNGKYKKMDNLISDLKKEKVINELKAKQLRVWVGIRNAAAHGNFNEFKKEDTKEMLVGVKRFLTDFL